MGEMHSFHFRRFEMFSKSLWSFAILGVAAALTPAAGAATVYGLTTTNSLVVFDSATPGTASAALPGTGLVAGDTLVGLDFRPANGQLYGLGSGSRLYPINRLAGAATQWDHTRAF